MDRLTGRNKKGQGTLALKDLQRAFDKLADYEDIGLEPYEIVDRILVYNRVKNANDCNNCSKRRTCPYTPRPGHLVRINCPLWIGDLSEEERKRILEVFKNIKKDEKD